MGSTQHPPSSKRWGAREWRADGHTSGCDRPRRAVSPHVRGQLRKDGEKELEPPAAALRSERWVANESLRRCVAMTSATERLRASDRRGGFPLGADPLALHRPSGTVECGRGDSFGRSRSPRDRRGSPFGEAPHRSQGARQGRNTLPSPHVRVGGRQSGSGRQAKRPAALGGAMRAAASGTSRSKAQGSIERARDGNVARTQRTPRWKKALRSRAAQRTVATRKRVPIERREGTPSR